VRFPGTRTGFPRGPLHDAAEVSRAGIPTVMMFVQSLRGISHNKIEDTREEHLEMSVTALDRLANRDGGLDFESKLTGLGKGNRAWTPNR